MTKKINLLLAFLLISLGAFSESSIDVTFDKLGAIYHKNEAGYAICKVMLFISPT
jgi:hypothetical protein